MSLALPQLTEESDGSSLALKISNALAFTEISAYFSLDPEIALF